MSFVDVNEIVSVRTHAVILKIIALGRWARFEPVPDSCSATFEESEGR
jgi:hypothetical protein